MELGLREQKILDLEQCYTVTHTTHIHKKYFLNTRPKTNPEILTNETEAGSESLSITVGILSVAKAEKPLS